MPAAIPAVIGGVAAIGGSILSSKAQSKAAKKANAAQQQSAAAQLSAQREQMALQREQYAQNTQNFTPYLNSGYGAQSVAMQLLGLKPQTASQFNSGDWYAPGTVDYSKPASPATGDGTGTGTAPAAPAAPAYTGPDASRIAAMYHDGINGNGARAAAAMSDWQSANPATPMTPSLPAGNPNGGATGFASQPAGNSAMNPLSDAIASVKPQGDVMAGNDAYKVAPQPGPMQGTAPDVNGVPALPSTAGMAPLPGAAPAAAPAAAPVSSGNPITDMIRNTPGYQFQLSQGLDALNANAYAKGMGNSGATMKGAIDYGRKTADDYYNRYLSSVMGVAGQGATAASSLAGVSQNFQNGMQNSTNNMNSINQNSANNASGYAMQQGQNTSNMINGIAGGIGQIAGAPGLFGGGGAAAAAKPLYTGALTGLGGGGSLFGGLGG